MSRTQISTSVPEITRQQADELMDEFGYSMREVLMIAIEQMHKEHVMRNNHVPTLYWSENLPNVWVAYTNDDEWVQFPPNDGGFEQREPYSGKLEDLQPAQKVTEKAAIHLAGADTRFLEMLDKPCVVPHKL